MTPTKTIARLTPGEAAPPLREAAPVSPPDLVVLDPGDPRPGAEAFLRHRYQSADGLQTLHHQGGVFYTYTGAHYTEKEEGTVRSEVWAFAAAARRFDKNGNHVPFRPNPAKVSALLDATRALAHLEASRGAPCWLDARRGDPDPLELAPLANGILHIPSRSLLPASARLYTHHSFGFAYDPTREREPVEWLAFLHSVFGEDREAVAVLQEIMGYLLTPDTSQQKAFLIVGPKRSGKGTIGRIITAMLGQENVCAPTLSTLAGDFGLQPMIGKLLALISDARLSGRSDQTAIAERILTVSGEDAVTVERKHLPAWTGRLPTRFLILSNELPRIADASGALASRFVMLTLRRSFYGHEDPGLTSRLLKELPHIFGWALDGLERLAERGYFVQPASSSEAVQEMEDLGSPISAFIRDRCCVVAGAAVEAARLYAAWKSWCDEEGREHPGTLQSFGRDLRAAFPDLKVVQPRTATGRVRMYEGIGLV